MYIIVGLVFLLGASIGSAALCFLERGDKKSWITGRSQCPKCQRYLRWYELLPVVSYLLQKGQCRGCHSRIPLYTFYLEVYGGVAAVICYIFYLINGPVCSIFILMVAGYLTLFRISRP